MRLCDNNMLTPGAERSALILWALYVCFLSDIRTSEQDVDGDRIHRRQEYSQYYHRGHDKDKEPFQKNSMWTPPEPPAFTAVTGLL